MPLADVSQISAQRNKQDPSGRMLNCAEKPPAPRAQSDRAPGPSDRQPLLYPMIPRKPRQSGHAGRPASSKAHRALGPRSAATWMPGSSTTSPCSFPPWRPHLAARCRCARCAFASSIPPWRTLRAGRGQTFWFCSYSLGTPRQKNAGSPLLRPGRWRSGTASPQRPAGRRARKVP